MDKLIDKIRLVKSGDDAVMMEIIEKFLPLIGKYTRKLNYDEDCKSERAYIEVDRTCEK